MLRHWRLNSLLARTVVLIGMLLGLSLIAWLGLFALYEREPRAEQQAARVAAIVNLTRAALLAAQPDRRQALLQDLSHKQGIRIIPMAPEDALLPAPGSPYLRLVQNEIRLRLGSDTLMTADEADDEALWVSFSIGPDDYWLVLPRSAAHVGLPWQWLGWGTLTLLLSFAGGWIVVARINRPLKHAAQAALHIGQGHFDERLDESGADEIATLGISFNRMARALATLEHNRALMLAGISHDLRTPLARLQLAVEMAVADETERSLMIQDIDAISAMTRQFMDFVRPDDAAASIDIDLDALIATLVAEYRNRGIEIGVQGQAGCARLNGIALQRALTNLIENALRYGSPPFSLILARAPGKVSFSVMDCGPGLAPGQLEQVKQPFYRVDAARTGATGVGLGLAIVERIATRGGGELRLENRPGGGLAAMLILAV